MNSSDPALVIFQKWHRAVLTGDLKTFERMTRPVSGWTSQKLLDTYRQQVPTEVRYRTLRHSTGGSIQFRAVGCREGIRVTAIVEVDPRRTDWQLFTSGWRDVANETSRMCPL
jgi:hypothetical protein